jgi:hypothetical protein
MSSSENVSILCLSNAARSSKLSIITTFVSDVVLLIIMIIGLLRLRLHEGGMFGLGRLLWKQVGCDSHWVL